MRTIETVALALFSVYLQLHQALGPRAFCIHARHDAQMRVPRAN